MNTLVYSKADVEATLNLYHHFAWLIWLEELFKPPLPMLPPATVKGGD